MHRPSGWTGIVALTAHGAQPIVRSIAMQTTRTADFIGCLGGSLVERTVHGRRPYIEVRSIQLGIGQQHRIKKLLV